MLSYYVFQVMWSVPYNLNTYSAYFAVGISDSYFNSSVTTDSIFKQLYYYSGTFERAVAGNMVEYVSKDDEKEQTEDGEGNTKAMLYIYE